MVVVLEFSISTEKSFEILMPRGSKILHIGSYHGRPKMWALVEPTAPIESRVFAAYRTGAPITEAQDRLIPIGSFQICDGEIVFHLFEIKELIRP